MVMAKFGGTKTCHLIGVMLQLFLLLVLVVIVMLPTSGTCADGNGDKGGKKEEQLFLPGNYFVMHQDLSHATLEIKVDGTIEWDNGTPTLYTVFREQIICGGGSCSTDERMYTLEAIATRHWICMTGKGKLYTVHQQQYYRLERRKNQHLARIRHETTKRTKRRWMHGSRSNHTTTTKVANVPPSPPSDCLFKTFEFNPDESYERSVGIYSYPHSNFTHGRFLSIDRSTLEARSYRKPFHNLHLHGHVKITQLPISHLDEIVNNTRFGRGTLFNFHVRQCIIHLLKCPNHQAKIKKSHGTSRGSPHFYRIIQRCKRRAERTTTDHQKLPKCQGNRRRRLLRRKRRKDFQEKSLV